MSKAIHRCDVEPVPRYLMPDRSVPNYEQIIEQLQNCGISPIGSSYYYIKSDENWHCLCRIIHGGGKVFFHEIVNHEKFSISDMDIDQVVRSEMVTPLLPGHYKISKDIEMKLRESTKII